MRLVTQQQFLEQPLSIRQSDSFLQNRRHLRLFDSKAALVTATACTQFPLNQKDNERAVHHKLVVKNDKEG